MGKKIVKWLKNAEVEKTIFSQSKCFIILISVGYFCLLRIHSKLQGLRFWGKEAFSKGSAAWDFQQTRQGRIPCLMVPVQPAKASCTGAVIHLSPLSLTQLQGWVVFCWPTCRPHCLWHHRCLCRRGRSFSRKVLHSVRVPQRCFRSLAVRKARCLARPGAPAHTALCTAMGQGTAVCNLAFHIPQEPALSFQTVVLLYSRKSGVRPWEHNVVRVFSKNCFVQAFGCFWVFFFFLKG